MDDFGVLVKNYGIKPQGKSAPMASSKSATKTTRNYNTIDPSFGTKPFSNSANSGTGSFFNDQNDDIFGFNSSNKPNNYASSDVFDDVFQLPKNVPTSSSGGGGGEFDFDMESMFKGSMNLNSKSVDIKEEDLIWGFSGKGSTNNVVMGNNDLLSSDPVDDFFGKLGNLSSNQKSLEMMTNDDLIPGFGISNANISRAQSGSREKSSGSSSIEELEDFATGILKKNDKGKRNEFSVKKEAKTVSKKPQEVNFFDIQENFNVDSMHSHKVEKATEPMFPEAATDLDSFFSAHVKKKSVPVTEDTVINGKTNEVPDLFSGTTFKMEKKMAPNDFPDDFSSIFGGAPVSGVFEEIEGESEERRRLRFERHQRAKARMENALAEMNQREYEAQQEQEERHRISDAMDVEMKRWAAGKEGNLRALLSSLQLVLAPELGWRPVTLTDLITSSQVKIAYKKAALCVHPDKVQQKGASLEQKFVAEKVFDLLKEAWNKFNTEELR
ncbi:auxilin-related protein 2 [Amaranthus tricolor]|uniref:auxilin-related protein 2 n=1 Tax=Amaranthus tricolor TaxID=29722 RepID=UPI00258D8C5E|nr:auxilin-related protein 2 [Amaranthus tricolor]